MRRLVAVVVAMLALGALAGSASAQQRCNGHADLCSRPFSETVFAGTHNSMAADDYGWNFAITTQTHTIRRQLDSGIRALSLDIHYAAPGFLGTGVDRAAGELRSPALDQVLDRKVHRDTALRELERVRLRREEGGAGGQ